MAGSTPSAWIKPLPRAASGLPLHVHRRLKRLDAAGESMRAVKGAAVGLIENSAQRRDEIAVIAFRGASAEVLVEPTRDVEQIRAAFEYLPAPGADALAHTLELVKQFTERPDAPRRAHGRAGECRPAKR